MNKVLKNNLEKEPQETTKNLLEGLVKDIATKYKIEKNQVKNFIENEAITNIQVLKQELDKQQIRENFTNEKQLEELFYTLKGAKDIIKQQTSFGIKELSKELKEQENFQTEQTETYIENIDKNFLSTFNISESHYQKLLHPQKPHEYIFSIVFPSAVGIASTVEFCYKVGIGALKAPYHLYLLITKKGDMESIKKI